MMFARATLLLMARRLRSATSPLFGFPFLASRGKPSSKGLASRPSSFSFLTPREKLSERALAFCLAASVLIASAGAANAGGLSNDALRAGCTWSKKAVRYENFSGRRFFTHIECPGPGTGLCWKNGHDPRKGETPALSTDNLKECE
jgi:hypothetical protein